MRHLLERYFLNPHWRTIKIYGQAKVFGISATTIIVAPLLSRILIKLDQMEVSIRQAHPALDALFPLLKYHLELPLSIKFLVGSAVCALLGKGIYEIACPVYIKIGDTYEEFRNAHAKVSDSLTDAFLDVMQSEEKIKQVVEGLNTLDFSFAVPNHPTNTKWNRETKLRLDHRGGGLHPVVPVPHAMKYPPVASAVFSVLRDLMDDSRRHLRVACALFYGIAFVLLSAALLIQLGWAVRGMLL